MVWCSCTCICLFACACSYLLHVANIMWSIFELRGIDGQASATKRPKLYEFYEVEYPERLLGEGKCPLTYLCPIHSLIHLPLYTLMPKDWLAFCYPCPCLPIWVGLLLLSLMLLLHSNQWTWWEWSMIRCFPLFYYDVILVAFKGARAVSRVPLRKDLFFGWPPGKTVQPWGWNGVPLAE